MAHYKTDYMILFIGMVPKMNQLLVKLNDAYYNHIYVIKGVTPSANTFISRMND